MNLFRRRKPSRGGGPGAGIGRILIYDGAERHNLSYRKRMGEEIGPLHMGRVPGQRPSTAEWRIYWWLTRIMNDHWRGALERARK